MMNKATSLVNTDSNDIGTAKALAVLFQHMQRFVVIAQEEEQRISQRIKIQTLAKKEHLHEAGTFCSHLAFVTKGCLRMYLMDEEGNQQTLQFAIENWWIADFMSFNLQKPSGFSIQAIEPTTVLLLSHTAMDGLCSEIPALERYFRLILQKAYAASQMRIHYIYSQSAEARYHHFNNAFPEFVQRVPQYMLASYLGFTPEFLSKIRAKKQ